MALALGLLMAVLLIAGSALINGYALMILWSWFIVPVFGLPVLSLAASIGIDITVSLVTGNPHVYKDHEIDVPKALSAMFLRPILYLLLGLILRTLS